MKLVLLFVLVLLWHWVCALPCPSCYKTNTSTDAKSPEVQSYKNAAHHQVQKLGEKEKALLSTVSGMAKKATSYINRRNEEMTHLEEVDEPADSFIKLKKTRKWNKTKVTNEVKNDFSSTKILENDIKNSTKAEKGNSFKNDTKQVPVAKNNLDCEENSTEITENPVEHPIENDKEVSVPQNYSEAEKGNSFKNDTKQVPVAKNNLDCEENSTEITENPVKNPIENDKEVSVPQNYSEVGINKTEFIEDDLKNTTKSEKGVYLRNSSKEVSIAQNHFEVDKNNNQIIHHHHNPSKTDIRNLNAPKKYIARIKRDANEKGSRRYLPTVKEERNSGENNTDNDNASDSRYLWVHDVPPFRRKRSYDDNDQLESCDHHKAKNITIIIQNFLNDLGDDPSTTSLKPTSNLVSFLHRTKRSSYFQQDEIVNQPYQAEDGYSENGIELKDGEEKPKDFVDVNSLEDADKNLQTTESSVKKDSETETNNFEEQWKMRYRYYENVYQGPVPVAETKVKVLKRLKCTCVTMGEDVGSDDTSKPLIENYFVNTLESSAAINQETLCLMACEEQVQHHFQPKQMIFCAPLTHTHLDAHFPATNPLDVVSERSETIMCKMLLDNVNPPLQCMTYWLNMTFVEVALLMACCVVSLYGLCFILSKKKKSIPLYVATSATSK